MTLRADVSNMKKGAKRPGIRRVHSHWDASGRKLQHHEWRRELQTKVEPRQKHKILMLELPQREVVAPFMMEGRINNKKFRAMIDSGSPVTIFPKQELKDILRTQFLAVKRMPNTENYVDYNGQQLNLLGIFKCRVEVENKVIKKARILVAPDGAKAIIGRDWMRQLAYSIQPISDRTQKVNNIMKVNTETEEDVQKSVDLKKLEQKFPKLFTRRGKFKGEKVRQTLRKT